MFPRYHLCLLTKAHLLPLLSLRGTAMFAWLLGSRFNELRGLCCSHQMQHSLEPSIHLLGFVIASSACLIITEIIFISSKYVNSVA